MWKAIFQNKLTIYRENYKMSLLRGVYACKIGEKVPQKWWCEKG